MAKRNVFAGFPKGLPRFFAENPRLDDDVSVEPAKAFVAAIASVKRPVAGV